MDVLFVNRNENDRGNRISSIFLIQGEEETIVIANVELSVLPACHVSYESRVSYKSRATRAFR